MPRLEPQSQLINTVPVSSTTFTVPRSPGESLLYGSSMEMSSTRELLGYILRTRSTVSRLGNGFLFAISLTSLQFWLWCRFYSLFWRIVRWL